MKVSISQAAKMAGVQRSTFYRHVEEKGISLEDKDTKRPKVDVSELVRVYGSKLKTLEQIKQSEQDDETDHDTVVNSSNHDQIELITLREQVKHLEKLHGTEKMRLEEQIEMLKDALTSEKEERRRATALLTDQRSDKDKFEERERLQSQKFDEIQSVIKELKEQQEKILSESTKKSGFWSKTFAKK